jgi:hypothetical protein
MGCTFQKPVLVDSWESLVAEAERLQDSGDYLLTKVRSPVRIGAKGLDTRMRTLKSQAEVIHLMLLYRAKEDETRKGWIDTWWNSMNSIFIDFTRYQKEILETLHEFDEKIVAWI